MKILKLKTEDIKKYNKEFISMLKQSFASSFPGKQFTDDSFNLRVQSLKNYLNENKAVIFGCVKDNNLLGFIWFFVKDNKTIHINHFVVDADFRSLGIGKLLWNQVEAYAENIKIEDIELFVTRENEAAVTFYSNRNFEIDRFVMKKRLIK